VNQESIRTRSGLDQDAVRIRSGLDQESVFWVIEGCGTERPVTESRIRMCPASRTPPCSSLRGNVRQSETIWGILLTEHLAGPASLCIPTITPLNICLYLLYAGAAMRKSQNLLRGEGIESETVAARGLGATEKFRPRDTLSHDRGVVGQRPPQAAACQTENSSDPLWVLTRFGSDNFLEGHKVAAFVE
jgi:hypothetical protein